MLSPLPLLEVLANVVMLFLLSGCDVQVRPPESRPDSAVAAPAAGERDQFIQKTDGELARLQSELSKVDSECEAKITHLRDELKAKVSKEEATSLVQKELNAPRMRQRLDDLRKRNDELARRLDELEEQFGILPSKSEAPWLDFQKKRPAPRTQE